MNDCQQCSDTGTVTTPSALIESCHHCSTHDLAWSGYYAWLDTVAQEKRKKSAGNSAGNAATKEPTTMWQQLAARAAREHAERVEANPMYEVNQKVSMQWDRFVTALPGLLETHAGQWVVWLDEPRSFHDDDQKAFRWAAKNLDAFAGFVIACVEPIVPKRMFSPIRIVW